MKYYMTAIVLSVLFVVATGCTQKEKPVPAGAIVKHITLKVEGMTCGGCEFSVKKSLLKLDGVVKATADYKKGEATVSYIKDKVTPKELVDAINRVGYKASTP